MTIDKPISGRSRDGGDVAPSAGAGGEDAGAPASGARGSGSPIEFRLDTASGVPTYLQLVQQVEHALRLGSLKPGDQLLMVRDVVASLVGLAARHADPRTTMRYGARQNLDRHPNYILAAYMASGT